MKTNHALLIAALCLLVAGCKQSAESLIVKTMEVQYTARPSCQEKYNFRYDDEGRLAQVNRTEAYENEKYASSWKYTYDKDAYAASVKINFMGKERTASANFRGDYKSLISLITPEDVDEDSETGAVYLGNSWVGSYSFGNLVKAVFTEFTSDGIDSGELTWDEGLLVKYEGSDPSVFIELKEFEYLDTPNPFTNVDPVAYLLGISPYYWEGLAGDRPTQLISGYTKLVSDPWVEDLTIDHVDITYETDTDGRISHILQTVNGELETVLILSY